MRDLGLSAPTRSGSIIRCSSALELSNKIIQKGLAFERKRSGTVADTGRQTRPEILPRRLNRRGGASVVRRDAAMHRTEDLNVEGCEEGTNCVIGGAHSGREHLRTLPLAIPSVGKAILARSELRVIAMLQSPAGATIAAMMKATGWQQHSVRGFLAGVVRKRLKLKLGSKKVDGNRVYHITSGDSGSPPRRTIPSAGRTATCNATRQDRSGITGPQVSSTSRLRGCVISTSVNFVPVGTTC